MKKVVLITTGGTIGSVLGEESIAVDPSGEVIKAPIREIVKNKNIDLEIVEPINKNSEDFEPEDWVYIVSCIQEQINRGVRNIVITHGTDTLAYSIAAVSAVFGKTDAIICMTGSYLSPSAPGSDATLSVAAALECVISDEMHNGVYVAFRTSSDNLSASIFPGLAVKPVDFDGLTFGSAYESVIARFTPGEGLAVADRKFDFSAAPFADEAIPSAIAIREAAKKVGLISLHPGLSHTFLENLSDSASVIVAIPYHSGTGPTSENSGLLHFLRSSPPTKVFLSQYPGIYIPKPYASTLTLHESGCVVFGHLQAHILYTWSVWAFAIGLSPNELLARLESWRML